MGSKRQNSCREEKLLARFARRDTKNFLDYLVNISILGLLYFLLVILLFEAFVVAEPSYGRDYLAFQSPYFSEQGAARYVSPGFSFGVLDVTFSSDISKTDSLLAQVPTKYIRIHLINGPCIRGGNCGTYEIGHGYNKASWESAVAHRNPKIMTYLKNRTEIWKGEAQKFPATTFIISPELEHDLTIKSWRIIADQVKLIWPTVQLSNSPDGNIPVERYLGAWLEGHGATPNLNSDIVSTDGQSISYVNINAFKKRTINAKLVFAWEVNDNCRLLKGNFVDPRKRPWCPNNDQFQVLAHILDNLPNAPKFSGIQCKTIKPFNPPLIWKPFAEQGTSKDPRIGLPCVITSFNNKKSVQMLSSDGSNVGSLGYYGVYKNMFRYYSGWKNGSGTNGYQLQDLANRISQSPWTWVRNGNSCQGPLLTGRRQGAYN